MYFYLLMSAEMDCFSSSFLSLPTQFFSSRFVHSSRWLSLSVSRQFYYTFLLMSFLPTVKSIVEVLVCHVLILLQCHCLHEHSGVLDLYRLSFFYFPHSVTLFPVCFCTLNVSPSVTELKSVNKD